MGLKIVESFLGRATRKDTTATSLRTELRLELATLRTEIDKLKREVDALDTAVDDWRSRYYGLLAANAYNDQREIRKIIHGEARKHYGES